jgi:hypothetical protein
VEQTERRHRHAHVGCKLSEGSHDSSVAKSDVTRILESTNESRSTSEQCSFLVAVRDDERTEIRQSVRKWIVDSGDLANRRLDCHQTRESVLLNTLRYRHHHKLLVVDMLDPCVGATSVSTYRARRCLSRRSSVRRPLMRLLARPPCCHAAGGTWTWMRLCRSSVQLPRPASGSCHGGCV